MAGSWESCFNFATRYTVFSFLPPFENSKFRYFTTFFSAMVLIRVALMIPMENKTDYEIYFSLIKVAQTFFNTILFVRRRKEFSIFLNNINDFLLENETNPVNAEGGLFVHMWDKFKPKKMTNYLFWSVTLPGVGWLLQAYFKMIFDSENVTHSPTLFYSPGFAYSLTHKWFYTVFDTLSTFALMAQIIQADIVIIVLLSFLQCQFLYMKYLLDSIFERKFKNRNHKTNKIWIKNHHNVFSLWYDLNRLLKPHVTVNYLSQISVVVFNILSLMDENTNMSIGQKVMISSVIIPLLFVLGYQCGIVEEINEIHSSMYESLLKAETIYEKKKETFFLKMLMLRCQRPIIMSGYGLFCLSRKDYKDLVLNIYKFYSSLVSVKRNHGKH